MYKLDSFMNQEESWELVIEARTDDGDIMWQEECSYSWQ